MSDSTRIEIGCDFEHILGIQKNEHDKWIAIYRSGEAENNDVGANYMCLDHDSALDLARLLLEFVETGDIKPQDRGATTRRLT